MDRHNLLSLLGLALRGGNLAVGEEPVEAAARARDVRLLLLAADAAGNTERRAERFAGAGQCLWLRIPFSKAELGRAVGRTSVAIVAVTDTGLASALAGKLAALDPERYGEAAQRLELKARRAAERRAEQRAHEKSRRSGKRKPPKAPAAEGRKSPHQTRAAPPPDRNGPTEKKRPAWRKSASGAASRKRRLDPYAHSRPVKKGKGSFRKREDGRSK